MRKTAIGITAVLALALGGLPAAARGQTRNDTTKTTETSQFEFPNDCTGEVLDVTTTSYVSCHEQLRADGTASEKCAVHEQVDAVGQTSGTVYHGSSDFKTEIVGTDPCNFAFTNRGGVRLITAGSDSNLVLRFEDIVRMEACVLTTDLHPFSADCRGRQ